MPADDPFDTTSHMDLGLMRGFPPRPDKRVTRFNGLWEPPFNRWCYQNMRQMWPTAPITASAKPRALTVEIDLTIAQLSITREDETVADFDTFLRQTFTDSLVVLHSDRVVYERYLNGMTPQTPHIMFSCTKSFLGLFALMAIEEGRVTYETPIVGILPELKTSGFAEAQFGHVLDMTAALAFNEEYDDPEADIHDYAALFEAGVNAADGPTTGTLYDYISTLSVDKTRPHGHVFEYQTPQSDVLNWAVNRLLGQSFVEMLEARLWSKLGMETEAYVLLDATGVICAAGGLNATARDLARFASLMLRGGRLGDDQIIPSAVIERLMQGGSIEAFLRGSNAEKVMAEGDWSYCAQWWIRHTPGSEAMIAIGVNGQWIYIDHNRQVAIIKQSSQPEAESWYFDTYTLNAMDAIGRHVAGY